MGNDQQDTGILSRRQLALSYHYFLESIGDDAEFVGYLKTGDEKPSVLIEKWQVGDKMHLVVRDLDANANGNFSVYTRVADASALGMQAGVLNPGPWKDAFQQLK